MAPNSPIRSARSTSGSRRTWTSSVQGAGPEGFEPIAEDSLDVPQVHEGKR